MKKNEHSEALRIAVLRVSGKPVRGYRLPLFNSDAPSQTQPLRGHKDQLTVTQQGAEEDPVKKARQEAKYLKGDVLKTNLNKKRLTAPWKTNLNSRFCCLDFGVHLSLPANLFVSIWKKCFSAISKKPMVSEDALKFLKDLLRGVEEKKHFLEDEAYQILKGYLENLALQLDDSGEK